MDRAARGELEVFVLAFQERLERPHRISSSEGEQPLHSIQEDPVVSNEVDDDQRFFVLRLSQAAAELLEEDDRRLRGPQHDHAVHRGHVHAFVEHVHGDVPNASVTSLSRKVRNAYVVPDGPGDKGGLKAGDIVTQLNGKVMENSNQLRNSVADLDPESKVDLEVVRNGSVMNLQVELGTRDLTQLASWSRGGGSPMTVSKLGLSVEEPTSQMRDSLNISVNGGVVVTQVDSASMARQVGVREGDLIVSINGSDISSMADFHSAMDSADLSTGRKNASSS